MIGQKRKFGKSDRKINQKNKNLMIDKILSYTPMLQEGIEVYKDANRNFIFLICLGALLINFPLISVPCCILSMFFIVRMLQFIKYKSINNIVKILAKDISYKGIYDKEKAMDMLDDFRNKYGEDAVEYKELVNMLNKYEALVTKIACVLRNIKKQERYVSSNKERRTRGREISFIREDNCFAYDKSEKKEHNGKEVNGYYNGQLSVMYKKEDGEIKKVNKAIEFFEEENNNQYNTENAVILKNLNKEDKNLTVYLYKKSSAL